MRPSAPSALRLRRCSSQRGSLLVVTMLVAGIIGVSLVSYLRLATTALNTANRSFYANSSVDLAEIGIEQAMACFYQVSSGTAAATAWTGWTLSGSEATRTFSGFTPGPNTTGVVRVYVRNYTMSGTPLIVAKATITPPTGATIDKWVEVTLTPRSIWAMGMVARNTISFTGNANVDSWNSDPDNDSSTAAIAYSTSVRRTNGTVGTVSSSSGAIDLGNGDIYGYISTGGGAISTSPGATLSGSFSGSGVDTSRISTDFSATFPTVTVPSPTTTNFVTTSPGSGTSFPRGGDSINTSDSKYYYTFGSGVGVSLSGNDTITVAGKCVFIMTSHSGSTAVSTSGNGTININSSGASLAVYTNGNISNSGNGFTNNTTQPVNCLIFGTATTAGGQSVSMNGNGGGGAAFYMPNASFTIVGNGSELGAIVAYSISLTGNAAFHYDEALGNYNSAAGVHVSKWKELQSSSDRATYTSNLNF